MNLTPSSSIAICRVSEEVSGIYAFSRFLSSALKFFTFFQKKKYICVYIFIYIYKKQKTREKYFVRDKDKPTDPKKGHFRSKIALGIILDAANYFFKLP